MVFTASLLGVQQIEIVWRTSRQACLFCLWARHLTGCLRLDMAASGGAKQSTRRGGPSLTEDFQTERDRKRSVAYIYIFLHKALSK